MKFANQREPVFKLRQSQIADDDFGMSLLEQCARLFCVRRDRDGMPRALEQQLSNLQRSAIVIDREDSHENLIPAITSLGAC